MANLGKVALQANQAKNANAHASNQVHRVATQITMVLSASMTPPVAIALVVDLADQTVALVDPEDLVAIAPEDLTADLVVAITITVRVPTAHRLALRLLISRSRSRSRPHWPVCLAAGQHLVATVLNTAATNGTSLTRQGMSRHVLIRQKPKS
jgi:hypothetical protein